jgi:transposase
MNNMKLDNQKRTKAKQIAIGIDAHLNAYQAAQKTDNWAVGPAQTYRSQTELLLYVIKEQKYAEQVVVVYEAGPLGYTLYRELEALGVKCLVCAPQSAEQKRTRRKNNTIDARSLTSNLSNYLNGNQHALQLVRVPTREQEQARCRSRNHDYLVKERKRIGARGNSLLLSQGYNSWRNWWRPNTFKLLSKLVAPWVLELLESWVGILRELDKKILRAKLALARAYQGLRPKGAGAVSLMQIEAELLDWNLYPNRRKIACLTGMVPSEWSTGNTQRLGSITKVGVPALRRIATEMVWRFIRFQPQYKAVQKWRSVLQGMNRALKKKAIVAIGRQLIVDLWRLKTGRVTAEELNLIMVGN